MSWAIGEGANEYMTVSQGSFTIIVNSDRDKLLLVKRRDVPVWDLPGGRLEKGESDLECAIREAKEETGLEIEIIRKIGGYYRPLYQDTQHIFIGKVMGGQQILNGPETASLEWFIFNKLPLFMVPNRKAQILDYVKKKEPIDVVINDSKIFYFFRQLIKKIKKRKDSIVKEEL